MTTLQPIMISAATLLVVACSLVSGIRFMENGKPYDDEFDKLFTKKAPVKDIIKLAVNWNAGKQLDHFDQLYHHINNKEKDQKTAAYSQAIVDATRAVLQRALKEVGYEKNMTLEQYLIGTYQVQNGMRKEVDPVVLEGLDLLEKVDGDALEKLLNEGSEQELEWQLNHYRPYNEVPEYKAETLKLVKDPENEPAPQAEQREGSNAETLSAQEPSKDNLKLEDQVPTPQESEDTVKKSEAPLEESQKPSEEPEETSEGSEEPSKGSEELSDEPEKSLEESEELIEETEKPATETEDSTEEVIAEPEKSEEEAPSLQES